MSGEQTQAWPTERLFSLHLKLMNVIGRDVLNLDFKRICFYEYYQYH